MGRSRSHSPQGCGDHQRISQQMRASATSGVQGIPGSLPGFFKQLINIKLLALGVPPAHSISILQRTGTSNGIRHETDQTPHHAVRHLRQDRQRPRPVRRRTRRPQPESPRPARLPQPRRQVLDAERPHRRQTHQPRPRPIPRRDPRPGPPAGAGERPGHRGGPRPRRRSGRGAPTFAEAADKVMAIHAGNWKPGGRTEDSWRSTQPFMAGTSVPAMDNLFATDGAVSPERAAAPAEDPRSGLTR